jgi:flagellin
VAIPDIDLAGGDAAFPASRSGADLQKTLNDAFNANPALVAAGLVAAFTGNALTISSGNNTSFRLNAGTSGAAADIGFGIKGAAFTSSLTAAQAGSHTVDCTGTTAVAKLSFNGMVYGNDPQTITVSTTGVDGRPQTASITLRNDAQGQSGRSIDETIAAINAHLQQGTSPLRQVVAVKENVGGEERIGFVSSLRSFQVIAGSSANSAGVNGGAPVTENSFAVGALLHVSVDTADSARLALTAVVDAVSTLGAAQAVVGKAQNQLSYAIDLSQSEVTNFSSAESRIRDADVAADAANLTKAQILGQASISIMSPANTLSQAVLALLRG